MGINIKENEKILVVAPHPDDESIGCGGLLSIYGKQCDVVVITDGDDKKGLLDIADVRQREFEKAMTFAGIKKWKCLRIPERKVKENINQIKQIDFSQYAHIFVPNRHDEHKDHVAVYKEVKKLAGSNAKLYEYEVWSPLRNPNIYLDITKVSEQKVQMIQCHESQVNALDYVGMIMGLNAYRGRSRGFEYAECFYCEKEKRAQFFRRLKRNIRSMIKQ